VLKTSFAVAVEGFLAAHPNLPGHAVGRLHFWCEQFGPGAALADIDADQVDAALAALKRRGKAKPRRGKPTEYTGEPMAEATLCRYASSLGGLYRWARKERILPRSFTPPTRGLGFAASPLKTTWFTAEEVARLVAIARALDRRWGRMAALIAVAFCTGWRAGNLKELRWSAVSLDGETPTITAARTKNGAAIVSPLSSAAVTELQKLPGKHPDALVFGNGKGGAFHWRSLWAKITSKAGLHGRNFHLLRHACGSHLAASGANQAMIMEVLGHRTLHASRRYMHQSVGHKASVITRVFG
jgi:integrase